MINVVIPMAGLGSRFLNCSNDLPKPLIEVQGKTLIEHSVSSLNIDARYIFITRKFDNIEHNKKLSNILKLIKHDSIEIQIDHVTSGSSETCLYAKEYIDNNDELIITNCDQLLKWDSNQFLEFCTFSDIDGCVVLYKSNNPKNSFCEISNGIITNIKEKNPISDNALIGVHYWKRGTDFIKSAQSLQKDFIVGGYPETYISSTYNYLINSGLKIVPFFIPNHYYISLGTPEDISKYIGKCNEYYIEKPKTLFIDIDGTILKHVHCFSELITTIPVALSGTLDKINQWDSLGHKIIFVTARKESARNFTETQLNSLGFCWDQLIMGVSSGVRVLINDKLYKSDIDRAQSINIQTDIGFNDISWEDYGL